MLIEVNLAPGSGEKGRRPGLPAISMRSMPAFAGGDRGIGVMAALTVIMILALGMASWRVESRTAAAVIEVERQVADSTRYAGTIELVESLRARQDTIARKIEVIRTVDSRRYVWPHLLEEISTALPAYIWLTAINADLAPDSARIGPRFSVQGNAGSTQALTRFMKDMEVSSFVRDVTLITSEQDGLEGRTIHRFSIEAVYSPPSPSEVRMVPIIVMER